MIVFHVLEVSSADQVVFPQMVEKVKVWPNVDRPRATTIVVRNVLHPSRIAKLALLEAVWFGDEHPVIAEPAFALCWQHHIQVVDRYVVYPAVDVVDVENLIAIAIPEELAREPPLSTWWYR